MTYLNQPSKKLLPCPSCPWRVDQQVSAIPNYSHPKACNLLNTVGEGDALRPIMACHGSKPEDLIACKGYLARVGWSNINVRLLLAMDKIEDPTDVAEACEAAGIELHETYAEVLGKLEVGS